MFLQKTFRMIQIQDQFFQENCKITVPVGLVFFIYSHKLFQIFDKKVKEADIGRMILLLIGFMESDKEG